LWVFLWLVELKIFQNYFDIIKGKVYKSKIENLETKLSNLNLTEYDSWSIGFREAVNACIKIYNGNKHKSVDKLLILLNQSDNVIHAQHSIHGARCGLDYFRYFNHDQHLINQVNNDSVLRIRFKYATCLTSDIPEAGTITRLDIFKILQISH